jgi:hypothetical protein
MTLAEPVLIVRRALRAVRGIDAAAPAPPDAVDVRLGATLGSVHIELAEPLQLTRNQGRRGGVAARATDLVVAVVARRAFLEAAAGRRAAAGREH